MSVTTLQTQLAAELVNLRKLHALRDHAKLADNANYNRRLLVQSNGYSTSDNEEAKAYANAVNYFDDNLVPDLESQFRSLRDVVESRDGFFGVLAAEVSASKEDIESAPIEYEHLDTDGVITTIERRGLWGALARWMELNGHKVVANVVTPGSLTAKSGNSGLLTGTTLAFKGHCPTGVITIKCVDDDVSAPKFTLQNKFDTARILADGTSELEAASLLQAEKAFNDGETGADGIVLTRTGLSTPTESGDNGNMLSSITVTTPKSGDCDEGIFYLTVLRDAGDNFDIYVFNNSARTTGSVGFKRVNGTSGTESVSIPLSNGSTLAFTFSKTNAHSHLANVGDVDEDISIDIETPRLGDEWTFTVTNDYAGNFQSKIMQVRRISLPITGGGTLFTDALAASIAVT